VQHQCQPSSSPRHFQQVRNSLLHYQNLVTPISLLLNLGLRSTCCITKTRWCCQLSATLLETSLFSRKTIHQNITFTIQSRFCTARQPSSSVLTSNSPNLNTAFYCMWGVMHQHAYHVSTQDVDELLQRFVETAQHGGWCDLSLKEKHWETMSMQTMVNSSCDIACLKFKLLYNATTSLFHRNSLFAGNSTTSTRWMSCAFHKVVRWHFSGSR